MCLQTRILKEYRSLYPHITLRETAAQTNINLTRIFRLYNGSAMKLEEYERFHEAVYGASTKQGDGNFRRITEVISRNFNRDELIKVTEILERHVRWNQLVKEPQTTLFASNSVIA